MSQIDPWEKDAECARAIEFSADLNRKAELTLLQHMWIALANEQRFLSPEETAQQIETIGRLQVGLEGEDKLAMH
jgi:hypothetical protein